MKRLALLLLVAGIAGPAAAAHLDAPRWARHYNAEMKAQHRAQRIAAIACVPYLDTLNSCKVVGKADPSAPVVCLVAGIFDDGRIHDQRPTICPWDTGGGAADG